MSRPLGEVERAVIEAIHEKPNEPREFYVGRLMSRFSQASVRRAFVELSRRRYIHADPHYHTAQRSYDEGIVHYTHRFPNLKRE